MTASSQRATAAAVKCYLQRLQLLQQCVEALFRDAHAKLPTEQVQQQL
jgi:hypothetical protein